MQTLLQVCMERNYCFQSQLLPQSLKELLNANQNNPTTSKLTDAYIRLEGESSREEVSSFLIPAIWLESDSREKQAGR